MIFEVKRSEKVEKLFERWNETMIWSCLQNVMGHLYVDCIENPSSVMAIIADFCFFAGKPNEELVLYKPEICKQNFIIMVPQNEEWAVLIEKCYKGKCKKVTRYAIKKEKDVFDIDKLQGAVDSLDSEYSIKMIDKDLFYKCRKISWCRDFVSQYDSFEMYKKYGLGVVILKDGEIVSGASSYTSYIGGIEVEIDTKEEYRRRGLAYVCGAKLILECLKRNLYPSWDAQNRWSAALSEKLGYHFDHEYTAYEIYEY